MPNADLHRRAGSSAVGLVLTLALCQFTALMDRSLLAALVTPIKASLDLTDTQIGLLQGTGFAVFYALAIVPAGLLADRVARRRLLLCGLTVWSLGVLGYASAPGFPWLFAASLLVGLGQSVVLPSSLSLIAERVATARRARATSVLTSAGIAGRAAALIAGGGLIEILSRMAGLPAEPWRIVVLASLLLNLALVAALLMPQRGGAPPPRTRSSRIAMFPQALRWMASDRATYALLLALMSATVLAIQGAAAWTPTLLHRRFALDIGTAALASGLVTVLAGVAGHALGGWATDRAASVRGPRGAFGIAAAALALACPGLLLFTQGTSLGPSLAGLTLFVLATGAAAPTALTLLQSITQTPAKGTVSGLMLAATMLVGLGLGPFLIGLASDRNSANGDSLGAAVLSVVLPILAIGIAAAVAGFRRGDRYRRPG